MTVLPPFNIAELVPADNAIVSQFPGTERTFRDTVESWLLTNHNTMGRHSWVEIDQTAVAPVAATNVSTIWAHTDGTLRLRSSNFSNTTEVLGVPVGCILPYSHSVAPEGFVMANGQAISRTTYARYFALVGTAYGVGNGSTTFNVPDLRGRTVFGMDDMGAAAAGRVTGPASGISGIVLGANGGTETVALNENQLPPHVHVNTLAGGTHTHANTVSEPGGGHTHGSTVGETAHTHANTLTDSGHSHLGTVGNVAAPGSLTSVYLPANTAVGNMGGIVSATTGITINNVSATAGVYISNAAAFAGVTISNASVNAGVTISNGSIGAGFGHNNMPPTLIMTWILKV